MYVKKNKQIINIKSSIQILYARKISVYMISTFSTQDTLCKYNHGKLTLEIVNQVTFTFRYHQTLT